MGGKPRTTAPKASAEPAAPAIPQRPADRHRLEGLEPDNLLAFLALLGLLRALDASHPEWAARAFFDPDRPPLRPVLTLAAPQTPQEIAQAAAEGVASLAQAHRFDGRRDLNHTLADARAAQEAADVAQAAVLAALMSDGATKDKDGTIWPAPLCFLFGQGHQHFLERFARVPLRAEPPPRGRGRKAVPVSAAECLAEALFAPWARQDQTDGFRWDRAEDRRYALRAFDPSGDPAGLQHGANRLAAVGLPALSGATVLRRGETRFLTRGAAYRADGRIRITWPIWTRPARLAGIRSLLAHPALAGDAADIAALAPIGVVRAMRADRISVGKFFNVTTAREVV